MFGFIMIFLMILVYCYIVLSGHKRCPECDGIADRTYSEKEDKIVFVCRDCGKEFV